VVGQPDAARHAWQDALAILDDLQHPDAERARARLSGSLPAGLSRTAASGAAADRIREERPFRKDHPVGT